MVIKPKVRGFICTTAHPVGCEEQVRKQVEFVKSQPTLDGPKRVLVIGSSTGYGLASRIAAAFGSGASTLGICFEKEASDNRTATAGWYNSAAFHKFARESGLPAWTINGDAFSDEIKQQAIDTIRSAMGQVDCVIYSLASPRRTHPKTGETFSSVLKPINASYTSKTVHFQTGEVTNITLEAATEDEIVNTVAVMGGEDWAMWMHALSDAGVLAEGVTTVAYSYIGPEITHAVYREGTIGRAKDDLERTAHTLSAYLQSLNGRAFVSVNKAVVTQSSSAIPVVPLYIALLFRIMKEKELHEGCIEQMRRLFADRLYAGGQVQVDEQGRIRLDDWEMRDDVQSAVAALWNQVDTENIEQISDIDGYREDFLGLFGFDVPNVDYEQDVSQDVQLGE
jgi:enoyl-[acyl-carrier protein] reductase/trans-2-enoyl-CoA reductase (NAD+)